MKNPTPKQVQEIYKYTYMIFTKYKDSDTDQDFRNLLNECHKLHEKYPFKICENQLMDVCNVIDGYYKRRNAT